MSLTGNAAPLDRFGIEFAQKVREEQETCEHKLILNVDKEKLGTAPGFEKGETWPDFSDTLWGESIYNYYNYVPPGNP
jgi:hypothetical protein